MYALISDLHSNIEALSAVFADLERWAGATEVYCLGDVVGYGPNPRECLDLVRQRCAWTLMGNHEAGLLHETFGADFNDRARRALNWTRETIEGATPKEAKYALWSQIDAFVETHRTEDAMFVHGSPRDPIREYVMPQDSLNAGMMRDVFEKIDRPVCFAGHTHVPGVFTPDGGFKHESELPQDQFFALPPKAFVNVGSVGQPRDGDPRACYALVEGTTLRFRRVPYDFPTTMRKIKATPQLDDFLAARLKAGK